MAGEEEKGNELSKALVLDNIQNLRYISSLSPARRAAVQDDERRSIQVVQVLLDMAMRAGQREYVEEIQRLAEDMFAPAVPQRRPKPSLDSVNENN